MPRRRPGQRWADLRLRIRSSVLLAPIGLICLWLGGAAWAALVLAGAVGLALEWAALCRPLAGAGRWAVLAMGVPYIGATVAALLWLRADPVAGLRAVLFVLLVVWASDIGAYLAGRAFGGPRLAPAISPGKTWSGAAGGLIAAALVGVALGATGGRLAGAIPIAVLLGLASQAGDLLESGIKRGFGVKDSGSLIPGHGGLFDRLDGLLAAAPVAALLAMLAGRGVVFW